MTKWIGGADDDYDTTYNPATPGVAEASKSVVLDANKHINEAFIGTAANYTQFESDGTLVMHGDAMVWDDLMVPATAMKLTGNNDPAFSVFKKDQAGSSIGVWTYWYHADTMKEIFFCVQMPHSWAGTAIYPHVHWTPSINGSAGLKVDWGLEYSWADIGQDFPVTQTVEGYTHYPADSVLVAGRHYLTAFTAITPLATAPKQTGISSMLICRLYRDAADATNDTYTGTAGLFQFDIHYEKNTIGSRQELVK